MVDGNKVGGLSSDTGAMTLFQSRRKSVGVAYLLLLLLGGFGVHRFYLRSTGVGTLMLVSTLLGFLLRLPLVVTATIFVYDLFTIPSQVRRHNDGLMAETGVRE